MLWDDRADLVAKIAAEGFQVADDPRNLVPPCVLVGPVDNIRGTGVCLREADVQITVVGVGPGNTDAAVWLVNTTEQLHVLLNADDPARTGTTAAGSGNQRLPVYRFTVPIP